MEYSILRYVYTSYKVLIYPTKPSVLSITISIIPIFSLTTTKNSTIPFSSSNQVLIFRVHLFQLRTSLFFTKLWPALLGTVLRHTFHQLQGFFRTILVKLDIQQPFQPTQRESFKKRAWPKNLPSLRPATKRVCSGAFPRLGTCNYQNESKWNSTHKQEIKKVLELRLICKSDE